MSKPEAIDQLINDARVYEHRCLQRLSDAVTAQLRTHEAGGPVHYGRINTKLTACQEATVMHEAHVTALARALRRTA